VKYRRIKGSDTWHWCTNCSQWPDRPGSYDEVDKPAGARPSGDLDNQCKAKEQARDCRTLS
jgi:hypothetical protein